MAQKFENEKITKDYRFSLVRAYIWGGFYSQKLEYFLKYFSRQNMFFIVFEDDLLNNKQHTIATKFGNSRRQTDILCQ